MTDIAAMIDQDLMTAPPRFVVICEDHKLRHGELFPNRGAAEHFANWGHCCTTNHLVQETRLYVAEFPKADWARSFADRLAQDWDGFRAFCITHRNGRRLVTWRGPATQEYASDLAETVGYYGSPPQGPVATLNGHRTPRSY